MSPPPDEEQAVDEPGGESGESSSPPVVFLDPSDDDRGVVEGLEEEIGCSVWTFEPCEFGLETFDEIADAAAIVVEWDLGGQAGLEVLETLLFDERTRRIPVLMASASPTRAIVSAALGAGARGFVCKPYEAGDLKTRLAPLLEAHRGEPD